MIQSRWAQNILLGFLAVLLIVLVLWGWSNGVSSAQSKRIIKDAQSIKQGFAEFYKDQNRYPSTVEFEDLNLMRNYITNFPPQEFVSNLCQKNFDYFNSTSDMYELRFCIPKATSGFQVGWNTLKP